MTALPHLPPVPRDPAESFRQSAQPLGFSLREFWQWQGSDLLSNAQRGILAEFIVARALGCAPPVREEWAPFDATTPDGVTVEVKSSAYIQSWAQQRPSQVRFTIRATRRWNEDDPSWTDDATRQAQVYVFCLFAARDKTTANPLDLDQWEFYALSSRALNDRIPGKTTIGLASLQELGPLRATFTTLRQADAEAAR